MLKAVILVGGEGTRLRPLTCNTHKSMVPILNRPVLEHMIYYLKGYGIHDIVLALCHLPKSIEGYFGNGNDFGVNLSYVLEDSPLGTAGAVKNAEKYLDDVFLVFNGDVFTHIDLGEMLALHRERKAKVSIALTPVENPTVCGVVETDSNWKVQRFLEKPSWAEVTTNLINAGIYILDPEILQDIPSNTRFMFEYDVFPQLLKKDVPVYAYPSNAYWIDIGTPGKYLQLHHDLLQKKSTSDYCNQLMQRESKYFIHPTAEIEGDVIIGDDCTIGARVRIKGPTSIGAGCKIHDDTTIEASVLWRNVHIGQKAVLRACMLGDDSFIGDDSLIPENSVIGDKVVIMEGSQLSSGTRIWPDTKV